MLRIMPSPKKNKGKKFTVVELFSGAGGLALGFHKAGLEPVMLNDFDRDSCETLRLNMPKWNVIHDDIKNLDFSRYKGADVVSGGFPCQAFSLAGKKLGMEDTRGTLFYEFARAVKEIQPKIFLAENVRGLLLHDKGKTVEVILNVFNSLGYKIQYKLLNAVNYGVPQKRERVIFIGTKKGYSFNYPKPENRVVKIREALKNCPKSAGLMYSEYKEAVLSLVPPGGSWVNLPEEIQKEYMGKSYFSGGGKRGMARRLSWDEPSLTLTTSPFQNQTERCHPDETRPFTVREYARIQTFPDRWNFSGSVLSQYKQIGNAVAIEFAKRLGKQIVQTLNGNVKTDVLPSARGCQMPILFSGEL